MKASEYRKRVRKRITCPSGLEVEIRKIRALDFLKLGILPNTLEEIKGKPQNVPPEIFEKIQKMYLVDAVIHAGEFKIVDKPLGQLEEGELSYLEIDDDDSNHIINEISDFSFKKEGGEESIRPFCEESLPPSD